LHKKNTIGELLTIKTGIRVSDSLLNRIKMKHIKRKCKLSNKEYISLMKYLRDKISYLETITENPANNNVFIDGGKTLYYYVSEKELL